MSMSTEQKVSTLIHFYGWGFEEAMRAYDLPSTREALKIAVNIKPLNKSFDLPNIDRSYLQDNNYISEGKAGRVFKYKVIDGIPTIIKYYFKKCSPQSIEVTEHTPMLIEATETYKIEQYLKGFISAKYCDIDIQIKALDFARQLNHNDIHLNNIMVKDNQFKLIDLEY